MSDRQNKLKKLEQASLDKETVVLTSMAPLKDAMDKMETFKTLLGEGVEINNLDTVVEQLKSVGALAEEVEHLKTAIGELKFPDMPDKVDVNGLDDLTKYFEVISKKDERPKIDLTPVTKSLGELITKIEELKVKPGQRPEDFIPTRRVMKVGNVMMYDDSFYTGSGGGGGGGIAQYVDANGVTQNVGPNYPLPTTATLDGSDIEIGAVEIKDGSTDTRVTVRSDGTDNAIVSTQNWNSTDSWPMYNRMDLGGSVPATDLYGALLTRGAISTDEGIARANFTGSAYTTTLGTCTFTNGSVTVTGSGFTSVDLHYLDFVKLNADAESAWNFINFVNSDTELTLATAYTGTGGTGTASRSPVGTITGTGATSTVGSGVATLALGTTASAQTYIYKIATGLSSIYQASFSVSQRIANQNIYFGYENIPSGTITAYSRFRFTGTTNTQVITETGYNPTTGPSASETETNTVTLPGSATTASANTYKIEHQNESVIFSINGVIVATHTKRIPHIQALNGNTTFGLVTIRGLNGTTPASGTSVVVDYIYIKAYDRIDTYQSSLGNVQITDGVTNVLVNSNGALSVGGAVASGAADTGNPVKIGGKYNASNITLSDLQRGDAQLDVNGFLRATLATLIAGEDLTLGRMLVQQKLTYSAVAVADVQIKGSPGILGTVTISCNDAAPTAGSIIIYDSLTETGTQVFNHTFTTTPFTPITLPIMYNMLTGIYLGFTTTGDVNVSVGYL